MARAAPRSSGGTRRTMASDSRPSPSPWNALWAMMIGFFMIIVDSTIVTIANPTIKADLHTGYDVVIWVTSAYLLGYAVVLLVAGRLGDRFGPKNLYLIGLTVFTAASLWCGFSGGAAMLIAARVVQGVGAGLLTPQTLTVITRIFPADRRGVAASVWGATAGAASLVGPLVGGALVGGLGWQWIFFVNIPVGIVGLVLAWWLVPELPRQAHPFDLPGVALSGVGMFLIVFGLQQGAAAHWRPWIWALIVAGVGFMSMFVWWQSLNPRAPLIPLAIFRDRDFSVCNVGVAVIAFAGTAAMVPLPFYAQAVCGLSPIRTALLMAPMAAANGIFAPLAGKIVDRYRPGPVLGFGFSVQAIALTWLAFEMSPETPIWRLALPLFAAGLGMAFVWSPLTATATRDLPPQLAGAGSAVFNSIRLIGAVLGSAGMAAFMTSRIGAEMPGTGGSGGEGGDVVRLPSFVREPFAAAMSQSVLLPAFVALFGIIAALFLIGFAATGQDGKSGGRFAHDDGESVDHEDDDDEYVELILVREPDVKPAPHAAWARDRAESWDSLLNFAHNGSRAGGAHTGRERRFGSIAPGGAAVPTHRAPDQ
ncbi:MAG: MFS transporter [Mycobacterium sp.]|nr:MFS transporter [Mycobacterium sp.]